MVIHDDVMKWKHFPRYWPFVRGIHRSPEFPSQRVSNAELWRFLWSAPWQTVGQTSCSLWCQCNVFNRHQGWVNNTGIMIVPVQSQWNSNEADMVEIDQCQTILKPIKHEICAYFYMDRCAEKWKGNITLGVITEYPIILLKSMLLSWRSGIDRFHPTWLPDTLYLPYWIL